MPRSAAARQIEAPTNITVGGITFPTLQDLYNPSLNRPLWNVARLTWPEYLAAYKAVLKTAAVLYDYETYGAGYGSSLRYDYGLSSSASSTRTKRVFQVLLDMVGPDRAWFIAFTRLHSTRRTDATRSEPWGANGSGIENSNTTQLNIYFNRPSARTEHLMDENGNPRRNTPPITKITFQNDILTFDGFTLPANTGALPSQTEDFKLRFLTKVDEYIRKFEQLTVPTNEKTRVYYNNDHYGTVRYYLNEILNGSAYIHHIHNVTRSSRSPRADDSDETPSSADLSDRNGPVFRQRFQQSRSITPEEAYGLMSGTGEHDAGATFEYVPNSGVVLITTRTVFRKERLYQKVPYSASPFDYLPPKIVLQNEPEDVRLFGIELELTTEYSERNLVDACDQPFFICKSDSTITGTKSNKVEMVTTPMSYKAHKEQWAYFFKALPEWEDNFDVSADTSNGVHIHVDRKNLTDTHIKNIMWFIGNPANQQFITLVCERNPNRYCRTPIWTDYAGVATTSEGRYEIVTEAFRQLGHYAAVSFSKKGTLEFRMFQGFVSYASLVKNIEFVASLIRFTERLKFASNTVIKYLEWIEKETDQEEYAALKEMLETGELEDAVNMAELYQVIGTETDPAKLVELVNKSSLKATKRMVGILNTHVGGRKAFLYDSQAKRITLVPVNRTKLAFLDKTLIEKNFPKGKKDPTPVKPDGTVVPQVAVNATLGSVTFAPMPSWANDNDDDDLD